jgi:phosphoserine phosphatase
VTVLIGKETVRGFASVILDVDSTLCGIEGIDWLAERRGPEIASRVAELTAKAMRGAIALDAVYGERLAMVAPTRDDISALADAYSASLAPGATEALARLRAGGRRVALVSGGLREAIVPMAKGLGFEERDVRAVSVHHDADGRYLGFDATSPLATAHGKHDVARLLELPRRIVALGDGATDLAMRPAVDVFAAFVGYARRDAVVAGADLVVESFDQLVELVLA